MPTSEYPHHMIREIFEEPRVVEETIKKEKTRINRIANEIKSEEYEMMYITGSGTSYHAGMAGQYALSNMTSLATSILPASEFQRWIPSKFSRKVLLMAISQSGESTDVLEAAEAASAKGMPILAMTNTPESRLARMSRYQLNPRSGKELAVPATKTYITQLASFFMFSVALAGEDMPKTELALMEDGLDKTPQLIRETLETLKKQIEGIAQKYKDKNHLFLLGSGPNYTTALEGALKLKETCTVFAEGFATREFLHGPMRLVDERTPIMMIMTPDETDAYVDLGRSLKNFGAPVILVTERSERSAELAEASDEIILVPSGIPKVFSPILYIIPIQLLAYYSSVSRGLNPDKPEKLTKVVI